MNIVEHADMSKYCSFKAGGSAEKLVIPESAEELKRALEEVSRDGSPYVILGNGTNTLFACSEYRGTVILIGEAFSEISVDGRRISCGAGALLSRFAKVAMENGLTGAEFAGGIPGSIGGAVFMNAGAYDGEIKDIIESAEVLVPRGGDSDSPEWKLETRTGEELELSYRSSAIQRSGAVVVSATFLLDEGERDAIQEKMQELNRRRVEKQPLEFPSAGSFFKRPKDGFAGKLIQDAGLAGLTYGGAQISAKHCGFMINAGGATYDDILTLMKLVQNRVEDRFGVKLEPEIRIIT